jgi:3-oxoacyl-[acyl-carrier protein] reductase
VKSLALELGPSGVRVNVVAPGLTLTDATSFLSQKEKDASALMTPLRRNGLPEDVAGAVLFLASEGARFITGAYLPVSGGIQMP